MQKNPKLIFMKYSQKQLIFFAFGGSVLLENSTSPSESARSGPFCIFFTLFQNVVIPLTQPDRGADSKGQALQQSATKVAATEAEAIFVQIGL